MGGIRSRRCDLPYGQNPLRDGSPGSGPVPCYAALHQMDDALPGCSASRSPRSWVHDRPAAHDSVSGSGRSWIELRSSHQVAGPWEGSMASRRASGRLPLADSVYDRLLGQFMDGTRTPGEPLNIATISRELDVSQTPIREALA